MRTLVKECPDLTRYCFLIDCIESRGQFVFNRTAVIRKVNSERFETFVIICELNCNLFHSISPFSHSKIFVFFCIRTIEVSEVHIEGILIRDDIEDCFMAIQMFDDLVTERLVFVYLSGGEAQRLAIARAMLKNAPVLILDEATAFADPDNETKVQAAFNELAKGRTVIMIAHRLSTVVNADRIFVLNEGQLSESGSFAELSGKKDSLFGTMWRDYQQSVRWKVEKEA